MNRCKKKVIPWHVQQRYMESFSQLSLNQTLQTAVYKKKIRSLQNNNKHLATALQRSRELATDKENLLIDNGKILNIINYSRVKLMDMAVNMKQATECLDETLLLLNSSLTDSLSKDSAVNLNYRNDFKNKLRRIGRNSPIQEVSENSDNSNKRVESYAEKGKISRVDGCAASPNKRRRLTNKEKAVKINCQDNRKSVEESPSAIHTVCSKNTDLKNSKICESAVNIKSLKRKKFLSKNSNAESVSSPRLSPSSSKIHLQPKTKKKCVGNKHKTAKVVLTDIAEAFLALETENGHSPVSNGLGSALNGTNVKSFTRNSEDDVLIKKYFSSEPLSKQNSSASNFNCSESATINNVEVPGYSQNIYNSSNILHKVTSFGDISEIYESPPLVSKVNEDSAFVQTNNASKIREDEINPEQNKGLCSKKTDSEKDKKSYKSQNLKATKQVSFYFDEDAIEKVEGNTVTSKDRIRKSINKCKARKTVSHKKKSIPFDSTVPKSSLILPDSVSKLGKNSFLVTAEVHSPPNGIHAQKVKSKICVSENMKPCVVLTDIFKSNRGLLSEMVGKGLQENVCVQKSVAPLGEVNTCTVNNNSAYDRNDSFVIEDDTVGEDHFLEDRFIGKKIFFQDRSNESKNICMKQPTVILRDIKNCRKVLNKSCNVYSNVKNRLNFVSCPSRDKENRCLPGNIEIKNQRSHRRGGKIVSYKEPSEKIKMRRL